MTVENERLKAARAWLAEHGYDAMLACADGQNSFLESNSVYVFTDIRSIGRSAVIIAKDGPSTLIVEPAYDSDRVGAIASVDRVIATDAFPQTLTDALGAVKSGRVATVALTKQSKALSDAVLACLRRAEAFDSLAAEMARIRTQDELNASRQANVIAESGYRRLLEVVRPGMREFELAADIYDHMRRLGAEDNFLLMSASQHNLAVRAAGRRILDRGDIILSEITPCYKGQFVQICRTTVLGEASPMVRDKYALLKESMLRGMEAAVPGALVADVTKAMNAPLVEAGYGDYCRPPYMRVRGHGLGITSNLPGDLTVDSTNRMEEGMVFVMHPNQYIPETGYLMCGESIVISHNGGISLSEKDAELDVLAF
ncbi:Xaa-Pro peptidase family protein [Roseiarcaceae bacterium H3SJ34-1]|uniref:M24 family metallopeptidase n=1 Tax=Terripilifer ovatus TaxID=3032367 RepID=UPI003AB954F6|nr:Xaa-Pro peptidase family protein [Roseiarcaceae bacterium H3SJ34-1]